MRPGETGLDEAIASAQHAFAQLERAEPRLNAFAYVLREGSATMWWMPKDD